MAHEGPSPPSRTASKASSGRKVAPSPEGDSGKYVDRDSPLLPIDWSPSIKYLVVFQVAAHAGMASWCASAFIPAFLEISKVFRQPIDHITYLVGAYTLMMGVGVLLWNPLADRFGRRPILLISLSICIIATCGVAVSKTYGAIMVARIFQGFGICAPLSLGAAYLKEMFPPKNRGTALGIWTLSITCGPFLAPFICGFIALHSTWTWIIWMEALMLAALLLFEAVFLPEAIPGTACFRNLHTFGDALFQLPVSPNTITGDFFLSTRRTFVAVSYPAVWLAGLAFAVPYGYIAVSISNLFPVVYGRLYRFNPATQGLLYLPMLIGSLLAEIGTGQVGDKCVAADLSSLLGVLIGRRNAEYAGNKKSIDVERPESAAANHRPEGDARNDSSKVPEMRLVLALLGVLICMGGLLWFGVAIEKHQHWASLAVATGFAAYGAQMVTSITFTYVVDCYPKSAKEVITIMNLFRVLSSFVVLFYNQRLNADVGYSLAFGVETIITAVFGLGGIGTLIAVGGKFR